MGPGCPLHARGIPDRLGAVECRFFVVDVRQSISIPSPRSASPSYCAMGHAFCVCPAELIKTVNRSGHFKGERERGGAWKERANYVALLSHRGDLGSLPVAIVN